MKAIFNKKTIILYLVATISMLLVSGDQLLGLGVYLGAVYCGNIWVLSILYIASNILGGWGSVVASSIHVAVVLVVLGVLALVHKQMGRWALFICCMLANVYYCIVNATTLMALIVCLLDVSISVAFSFVSVYT